MAEVQDPTGAPSGTQRRCLSPNNDAGWMDVVRLIIENSDDINLYDVDDMRKD